MHWVISWLPSALVKQKNSKHRRAGVSGPPLFFLFLKPNLPELRFITEYSMEHRSDLQKGKSMRKIDKYLNSAIILTFLFAVVLVLRYAN